jgi:hypothetical protein
VSTVQVLGLTVDLKISQYFGKIYYFSRSNSASFNARNAFMIACSVVLIPPNPLKKCTELRNKYAPREYAFQS